MMTNTLKDAADSAIETVSSLVHDARDQFEHLSLPTSRRSSHRSWWAVGVAALLVVAIAVVWGRQRGTRGSTSASVTDRESEKSGNARRDAKGDLHEVA
jgi:hypothetical protein